MGDERGEKRGGRGMKGEREREGGRQRRREMKNRLRARVPGRSPKGGSSSRHNTHTPPFYRVVKCPSLLALALCPFSFLFAPASPPAARFAPLHPLQQANRRVEYVRLRCALRYFVSLRGTRTKTCFVFFLLLLLYNGFGLSPTLLILFSFVSF